MYPLAPPPARESKGRAGFDLWSSMRSKKPRLASISPVSLTPRSSTAPRGRHDTRDDLRNEMGARMHAALGAFRSAAVRRVLSVPLVSAVGGACYTIYLFHFLLVSLAGRFIAPHTTTHFERNVLLIALPFAAAVTLACLCLFPFVERPFMFGDWPQRIARSVRERRPGPVLSMFARPSDEAAGR